MTLKDQIAYSVANHLYWVHIWAVLYPQILFGLFA